MSEYEILVKITYTGYLFLAPLILFLRLFGDRGMKESGSTTMFCFFLAVSLLVSFFGTLLIIWY